MFIVVDAIGNQYVQVWVEVKGRSPSLDKGDNTGLRVVFFVELAVMAIEAGDVLIDDALYFREELFVGMEPVAHGDGEGNNKLAVRNDRKDVIDEVSRGFSHSSTTATGAEASFFAGEGVSLWTAKRFLSKISV